MKLFSKIAAVACVLLLSAVPHVAHAARVTGSLGFEAPIGDPTRPQDDSPLFLVKLDYPKAIGSVGLFASGQVQTKKGFPWDQENKVALGFSIPFAQTWEAYSYAERRFNYPSNKFVAGVRYNFALKF